MTFNNLEELVADEERFGTYTPIHIDAGELRRLLKERDVVKIRRGVDLAVDRIAFEFIQGTFGSEFPFKAMQEKVLNDFERYTQPAVIQEGNNQCS